MDIEKETDNNLMYIFIKKHDLKDSLETILE